MASENADYSVDLAIDRCRTRGCSNLLLTFTKIWENFIDVKWQKELFDGKAIHKFQLIAQVVW